MGAIKFSIIVPTLNEAEYVPRLLNSLQVQTMRDFEVIVVDGGSRDDTKDIAESFGAKVYVLTGAREFPARNFGAANSKGTLFIFTCADVVLPPRILEMLEQGFSRNPRLVAITLPGRPYDGPLALKLEYSVYNLSRFVLSKLPHPLTRFMTSTNFLALRREAYEEIGGFKVNDINADGLMGRTLLERYKVEYSNVGVYISARRARDSGLLRFTMHYLYMLENYLPALGGQRWFATLKERSLSEHKELHSRGEQ